MARELKDIGIFTDLRYRISYSYDSTGLRGECGGVAFPESLDQLGRLIGESHRREVPVVVRGAGTGFSGGSVPRRGALVISTEQINSVLGLSARSLEVEVEAGMVNQDLQNLLEVKGLFYPPDPASLKFSTLGGNVAENAGGPRAYKYGVTRRYVRAITWVSSCGEVYTTPAEGLAALLIGAEGTLGAIYSIRLALLELPRAARTSLIAAGPDERALEIASQLISRGFAPSVMEYIDSRTIRCVTEYCKMEHLDRNSSYLFVEVDGSEGEVEEQQVKLEDFCSSNRLERITAHNEEEMEELWEVRRSISPSLARRGITKVNEDVSLPLGSLTGAVSFIHAQADELGLDCYIFGHSGDGNLHVNIMTDRRKREEMGRVKLFVDRLFHRVVELGGTISGEHGIGLTKSEYLDLMFSREEMEIQRETGATFDPAGIMNPSKYFDIAGIEGK